MAGVGSFLLDWRDRDVRFWHSLQRVDPALPSDLLVLIIPRGERTPRLERTATRSRQCPFERGVFCFHLTLFLTHVKRLFTCPGSCINVAVAHGTGRNTQRAANAPAFVLSGPSGPFACQRPRGALDVFFSDWIWFCWYEQLLQRPQKAAHRQRQIVC